jgi:ABC-type polysaccharide/polyol phosphate transport system ATPase subunit
MNKVGRLAQSASGNKIILRDPQASLGFYYGAKIGVLGLNGAGKSTLPRIIAGVGHD